MTFDNKKRIDLLIRLKLASILLFAAIFIWIYYAEKQGIQTYAPWLLSLAITVYLLLYLIPYLKDLHYLRVSVHEQLFTFRYYALSDRIPKAVEVSATNLLAYRFVKEWKGWRESLCLTVQTAHGRADYPPIRISLLTPQQREMLESELSLAILSK